MEHNLNDDELGHGVQKRSLLGCGLFLISMYLLVGLQ